VNNSYIKYEKTLINLPAQISLDLPICLFYIYYNNLINKLIDIRIHLESGIFHASFLTLKACRLLSGFTDVPKVDGYYLTLNNQKPFKVQHHK